MANVLCNLPKPGEPVRYVDVIVGGDGKDRLCVDALLNAGQITIGGVYIYDYNSGLGADVIPTGSGHNGLVVVAETAPRSKVTVYGSSIVATGATLTLATYTVPLLKRFTFTGVAVGGAQEGEFDMIVSAATICKIRNSGSNRTIVARFPDEPEASAGAVIEIKVTNIGDLNKNYEATIFGHNEDV